jgi:hypothetical protein
MTAARLHCQTPGCRRTRKGFGGYDEWVCQKCYDKVPPTTRREHVEAKRVLRKIVRKHDVPDADRESAWLRTEAAWIAVKDAARGGLPDDDVLRQMGVV